MGCDLLSIFDVLIFASTASVPVLTTVTLWFAFNLWRSDICFNYCHGSDTELWLWFAFNLWRSDICFNLRTWNNVVVRLWFAFNLWRSDICFNNNVHHSQPGELWFAFNLWRSDICFNIKITGTAVSHVVICFQSLTFWYLLQHFLAQRLRWLRCDLLSIFDVLIFASTGNGNRT